MAYIFPHTHFGPQFKHSKGVDIIMGGIDSLSTYPHYWKSSFVPRLLIGKINNPVQLAKGWTCHQTEFRHSDLKGITHGEHILMLLMRPNMIIRPSPYAEIPNQR